MRRKLNEEDQREIDNFAEFLAGVGGKAPAPGGAAGNPELKALIESDPDRWLPYLGIDREKARKAGYDV